MKKNKYLLWVWVIPTIAVLGLSACAHKIHYSAVPKPTLTQLRTDYSNELRDKGVQIVSVGETMRFILSSDDLFSPDSANLKSGATAILQTLGQLMNTYEKVNVQIAAYTDNIGNTHQQRALTTRQAQVVASFLWASGIDARLEYAVGLGQQYPVASNHTVVGRHDNRRVEVSFRYYPPTPYFY